MAMRTGEMMVIVRAQDFASRTLRRVGGEFAHLSREQQLMMRQQMLDWKKVDAAAQMSAARQLKTQGRLVDGIRARNAELARMALQREKLENRLQRLAMRRQATAAAQTTFQRAGGTRGRFGPADPALVERMTRIRRVTAGYEQQLRTLTETEGRLTDRRDQGMKALSRYGLTTRRAVSDMVAYRRLQDQITQGLDAAGRRQLQVLQAQEALNHAWREMPVNRLQDIGHALGGIGRTMQLFGAVTTVALGVAASTAANFNTEISLAATQARDLDAPFTQVATRIDQMTNGFTDAQGEVRGVLDLMQEFPANQSEMAAAAYDIFSSMDLLDGKVTDVRGGMELLAQANRIAVAGGEDLETATNAMITVLNNFDPKLTHTTETLDTMFDIIRFGRMRLADFNVMMNKVAPAAAGAGLSLRDVGGAMAFLTEVMPSQRMVATGISRLVEALNHPDIRKGLKMFGIDVRDLTTGAMRPLDDILQDIAANFQDLTTGRMTAAEFFKMVSQAGRGGGQGVMFTAEGRKALTQMITHMDEFLERQRQIDENTGEFNAAYQAQLESLGIQWQIFLNRLKAVVVAIGAEAIPVFQDLGEIFSRLLDAWQGMNPQVRGLIIRIVALAGVATLLGGIFLSVVGAMMVMRAALMRFMAGGRGAMAVMEGLWAVARRFAALGVISLLIKVAVDGPPGWQDLAAGGIFGMILGKKYGRMAMLKGGIVVPITLSVIGGTFDEPTQRFSKWLKGKGRQLQKMNDPFADWIGKGVEGIADLDLKMQGVEDKSKNVTTNFKASKEQIAAGQKILRDWEKGSKSPQATQRMKEIKQYFEQVKKYQEAQREYKQEMEEYKDAVAEWGQQLRQETIRATGEATDNLRKMYMELEQVNRDAMGELFQGPLLGGEAFDLAKEWGITANIDAMIKDVNQATALFTRLQNGLDKLRKKGVPAEVLDEIERMEPKEAEGFVKGILKGTPKQQAALIAAFKKRNAAVQSQTKMDFVDEIERFRKAGVSMGTAIKQGFEEARVGAWFDNWVQNRFPDVINAAVNQAVAEWRQLTPMPTPPKRPTAPVRPDYLLPSKQTINGNNNNSPTTTYISVTMTGKDNVSDAEMERRFGFLVRQAVGGRGRVTPMPKPSRTGPKPSRAGRGD